MENKKWPVLGKILIGLGFIGGLINIVGGLYQKNTVVAIAGITGLVIYWNVYKFKKWALIGLNVLLSLSIALALVNIGKIPTLILFLAICFPALAIFYFNSAKIKELFCQTTENKETGSIA